METRWARGIVEMAASTSGCAHHPAPKALNHLRRNGMKVIFRVLLWGIAGLALPLLAQINPVPCANCNGRWTDDSGAVWDLDTNWAIGDTAIIGTVTVTAPGCQTTTYSASGWLTRTPGMPGITPGVLSFTVTASAPQPPSGTCAPVPWLRHQGTISNQGCNTGSGTWNNAWGGSGAFAWSKACEAPNGSPTETTYYNAWSSPSSTTYDWWAQLNADRNFGGRNVEERDGGGGFDSCWFSGSDFPAFSSVTGGGWYVGYYAYNYWGHDTVGWAASAVHYYRSQRPSRGLPLPCTANLNQRMVILCNGGSPIEYKAHGLSATIDASTVGSSRDDKAASKIWP
jgi:hypothetical protein